MDSDALRSVRNAFYLGLYPEVAKEVAQLPKADKELQSQTNGHMGRDDMRDILEPMLM